MELIHYYVNVVRISYIEINYDSYFKRVLFKRIGLSLTCSFKRTQIKRFRAPKTLTTFYYLYVRKRVQLQYVWSVQQLWKI